MYHKNFSLSSLSFSVIISCLEEGEHLQEETSGQTVETAQETPEHPSTSHQLM